ncbi:sodium:melibiose symporter [Parasphingopyxis algicola]|uniref:MFS transporter n=1 Tax=Parasphingopyxis algicola TaxID=2026624 RepID=UPI0015A29853|nr:MFS transporter [Parasphingopyxis algicola]QLC26637.1 sodium:melibiose symporter [Parasphingopyxis algicola]
MADATPSQSAPRDLAVPLERKVPTRVKFAFGFGAIAFGIKDNGFSLLLLIYYNQVIGVPAAIVGAAVLIALVMDAFIDPIVGHFSDNLRTRWGRRHPFIYLSAIPAGLFFLLLWNPPEASNTGMFFYIFGIAFLVRATMSCFEVPMAALGPELTSEYHERTRIFGLRFFFGWLGGATMLLFTFAVLLAPTPEYPNGQLNPAGYSDYAIIASVIMSSVILLSALGTHSEIKYLPKVERVKMTLGQTFRGIFGSLSNRAFLILMLGGLCAYVSQGISFGLLTYFITYYWQLDSTALAWYIFVLMFGILGAVLGSTWLSRRVGKPRAAMLCLLLAVALQPIPYIARTIGFFPENGDPMLLPSILVFLAIGTGGLVASLILKSSMLTDVIEDDAEKTGRRSEGLFFAGQFFLQKCVSGAGVFISAAILTAAAFPDQAVPGEVADTVLRDLALIYVALIMILGSAAAYFMNRFPINEDDHHARIARMRGLTETT